MNHQPDRRREIEDHDLLRWNTEETFAPLLRLASAIAQVPSAAVNVVSDTQQINLAQREADIPPTCDRAVSFCSAVVERGAHIELPDTRLDERFAGNPFVTQGNVRFYAGFPITTARGLVLGVLCVFDQSPHHLTESQKTQLSDLARVASDLFEAQRIAFYRRRMESVMKVQSEVLRDAAMGKPLQAIADRLIVGMESCLPGTRAIVSVVTENRKRLRIVSSPSFPADMVENYPYLPIAENSYPSGIAAFRGQPFTVEDIPAAGRWPDLANLFREMNLHGMCSFPLFASGGELVGIYALYFEERAIPTETEREILDMITGTAAIIIEHDRSLRTLIESERQLQDAQEIAQLGAYSAYPETGIRTGSVITNRILGLPENVFTMTSEDYNRLIHPDDLPQVMAQRARASNDGASLHTLYRIIRQNDGAIRWVEGHGLAVKDIDGKVVRYTGVLQDVTERREAEQAQRLNQRAVESSSNGVVIVDALVDDMPIIYVNPAFEALSGYSTAEMVGRNCRFLQGEHRDQAGLRDIRDAIREKREGRALLRNFRKDGDEYWIDLRISPIRDEAGVVTHYAGFQTDLTDRVRYETELAFQAGHDSLTGIANRNLFQDRIDQALLRRTGTPEHLAVVFIDLDRFKLINDSMGHGAGDVVLKEYAARILALLRSGDTVARMGGDEFVLLLHDIDPESVGAFVQHILDALGMPIMVDGKTISVSASAGIAIAPQHGESTSVLLRNADIAMYQAKVNGRANLQFFSEGLNTRAAEKLELKAELTEALRQRQFRLHYQPKLDARTSELAGFEALVRWEHPERGLLYPGSFIQAAEEFGLIAELGAWVMREACLQCRRWIDAGMVAVPIAVNVSVAQARKEGFFDSVVQCVREAGIAPHLLELEITESLVMENPEQFIALLEKLHSFGICIAVDDFGTGYSSLSFVKQFPIDFLKIDQSFVRDITLDPLDAAICVTIITMGHNLGLKVVAEGVETEEQADFLRGHGCDLLQGYLISPPCAPQQVEPWLTPLRVA